MKTEFLQNFKVGDQALTKEIIDEILAENGRDIEAAKKPFVDYQSIKEQLEEAKKALKAFEGVDASQLQAKIKELQGQLTSKDKESDQHELCLSFVGKLKEDFSAAKGRSAKAISALLDMDALRKSSNQETDIKAALETLQKENGYLFETDPPAPYAPGPGKNPIPGKPDAPISLSAALHEKYDK